MNDRYGRFLEDQIYDKKAEVLRLEAEIDATQWTLTVFRQFRAQDEKEKSDE